MLTGRNFPYRAKTTANLRKYFKTTNKKLRGKYGFVILRCFINASFALFVALGAMRWYKIHFLC